MPRDLYLRLNIPIPNHKGYRFSHSTGTLLKSAGWNIVKETRKFSYLKPPHELAPGKTTDIKTTAPTDDEIIAVAQSFHSHAMAARKMVHAFPAYYRPASATSYSSYKVDPATGEKTPASEQALLIPAAFRIGLWEIWEAEVYWNTDGLPILVKRQHQEIPPPEPTLFDHIPHPDKRAPIPGIEYRGGDHAITVPAFLALAHRVWQRDLQPDLTLAAIELTRNIGAWHEGRLVGAVRVLSDGYLFNTIPEVMVDPEYRHHGIGRELMRQALALAPGGRLFFGAQPGNETFFERCGFVRGPIGFVGGVQNTSIPDRPDTPPAH
jgi:GNAT superfamily N-acetyltransferase